MTTYPTISEPIEFHNHGKGGGHAYLFVTDGTWHIEHCIAGQWHTCPLVIFGADDTSRHAQGDAARRHLARKTGHTVPSHGRLAATHHAGGGLLPYMKGPTR